MYSRKTVKPSSWCPKDNDIRLQVVQGYCCYVNKVDGYSLSLSLLQCSMTGRR